MDTNTQMPHYPGHPEYRDRESFNPERSRDVCALIYGCMDFAGDWNEKSLADMGQSYRTERVALARDILKACLEQGINYFDHADIYGRGKSEEIFAQAISELQVPREQYVIQSKCGIVLPDTAQQSPYYNFDKAYISSRVEASLKRLNTDYLDVLLLHRPAALVEPAEVASAFERLQQQGKVLAFGVSNHSSAQIELLQAHMPFQLAYNQMQISLLHHGLLSSGLEYNTPNPVKPYFDTIDYCRLNDIRLQAWSPVARGKIFHRSGSPKAKTRLQEQLEQMAQAKGCSPASLAIAWLLRHPAGIQPVVGTGKVERLKDYCSASKIELSQADWHQLLVAAREKNLP